jgi:pimeloyl-ACP methyl ester carboxylesterase
MGYVDNEGARLYWTEKGSGPPVLLIMGLSFTHEMWYRTLPALGGYRAILFDNRGMGRSSVPKGPYFIRQMARDAHAVLSAAGVSSAHVIGASMGGMIAQELALLFPQRVRSLILACTSYSGVFARWPDFRCGQWLVGAKGSREERERTLANLLYAPTTPMGRIHEDIRTRCACLWSQNGFLNQFVAILLWNAYWRLPSISAPTLVIHGDQDRLIPLQNGRVVARRIPGARFQLIQDAGHILTTDQPEICHEILTRFLGEQTGALQATGSG